MLYGFRICVQSLLNKKETNNNIGDSSNASNENIENQFLYSSILSDDCLNTINNYFIPGNDTARNLKLETLKDIEIHLNKLPGDTGCYVCSCGYYYTIDPCGFPTRGKTMNCPSCQQLIGFGEKKINKGEKNHGMVLRPGHFRIFKNLQQKNEEMKRFDDPDENIPNKTLEEYKKDIIEPLINKSSRGINVVSKNIHLNLDKNVRRLSRIGFRLLNFILYNHLFFARFLDYISKTEFEEKLVIGMNILEIIQSNWNLLGDALKEKGIMSTQIFMNMIFKKLSNLIKNCKCITNKSELISFEEEIENLIQENIEKYSVYMNKYLEINLKQLELKCDNLRAIITEVFPPKKELYPEEKYPLLQYFSYTKYRTKEDLIKALGPENDYIIKHPLLFNYLNNSEGPKKLKYLAPFNAFTNYMIEEYSYKISREDANEKTLENEPIFREIETNKFKPFIKAWENIYKEATKYRCRNILTPKQLKKSDKLIYFLIDDNEISYLAAACQNFITWQNNFLQPIIETAIFYGNLNYYVDNMKNKIPVQEANPNQILSIDECFNNSLYEDFEDIIYTFSKRDILIRKEI